MSKEDDLRAAWQGSRDEYGELVSAVTPAIKLLREYVDSIGGCDHDAGICICGEVRVLEDAERILWIYNDDTTGPTGGHPEQHKP